jgi:hypothetical protein
MEKCEHGAEKRDRKWDGLPPGVGMSMPLSTCSCCGSDFWYCDIGMGPVVREGPDGKKHGYWEGCRWTPIDRCEECGGASLPFSEPLSGFAGAPPPSLQERLLAYKAKKKAQLSPL